ncbi:MAG: tRNA (N6-isopentenyl adenosine(37)-C2)-methylthiotransferase MiaB [Lachnospiraceae bacterium]|nr:tRNA (N6-isopentenyl adenosine(37)-C2)-methylthiotransferase MiaB [Lachnospiraceae bacterium]
MKSSVKFDREASAQEAGRQAEFIEKDKVLVRALTEKLGRRPTACTVTFGCQMNAKDSEKIAGILRDVGYELTDSEEADFVIYNTCTVRDNADQRVFGRLGRISHFKKKNPDMKIALCGCMMQEAQNVEKIRTSYRYVDLVFGTHNLFRFPEYLCGVLEGDGRIFEIWDSTDRIVEALPSERKYTYKSGVNIMFGCDNFCTYCIVPYVRGRERSREPKEILREVEALAADGVTEVMLLGQNVNSYGKDLSEPCSFARLIEEVAKVPGIRRVRFMTPHPKDFSDELIRTIRDYPNIARHVHLPLQSGNSGTLKRMNRHYTKEQYIALAQKIRREIPDVSITADIIVGFPGETKLEAMDTVDVVRTLCLDNAYTFIYSKRQGTPAASMPDPVSEEEKKETFDLVLSAVQECARERSQALTGRVFEGLVEEVNEQDEHYVTARLSNNMLVHVPGDPSMIGKYYPVRLIECRGFYFFGEIVSGSEENSATDQ